MLLTKPLLRCPGGVFGIIVMLKDPATFHLQCPCWWKEVFTQNLTIHGPIHSFLYPDQSSWSLCRKTAPKHDVSTPMLHSRYGVLWMQLSILSPPNKSNQIKSLLLSHHHGTSALVSEILMSVLQTVQKKNNNNNLHMDRQCKKTTNNLHMDRQCKKKQQQQQFTYGQTVQKNNKQFTYGQTVQKKQQTMYIWTDSAKKQQQTNLHMDRQCKKTTTTIYIWTDSAKKQQTIYIWTDSAKKQQTIYIWTDSAKKTTNNLHMDRQCKKNNKQFTYGQTVQKNNKQFTYGQTVQKKQQTIYIWTDSAKKTTNNLHMDRQCKKTALEHLQCSRQCKKTTTIYIWTVHIYRLYRRQCAKYTYIYSVHIVYYKDTLNYQTRQVEFLPKSYILVSSDHMTFSQSSSGSSKCSLANFRRAWTCTGLSRGTRLALQDLSPWRRSVLLMVAFVTLVPALCRSFTRSPRVVLGFLLTVLVIILTPRGEILRGAPDRGRLSVVLYNCSHSWFFSHQAAYLLQIQSSQPGAGLQFCFWCPLTALWSWP